MKALAIAVGLCVASAGAAFALEGTTKPSQHFKALAQVQKPTQLTEGQLDKIEGQATLANANARAAPEPGHVQCCPANSARGVLGTRSRSMVW